jgi:hypothetical protein
MPFVVDDAIMISAAVAAAAPVITGLIGQGQAAKDKATQRRLMNEAAEEIKAVMPPDPESQKALLEEFRNAGVLTPEVEKAYPQLTSSFNSVSSDPRLKDAQMSALSKLQQLGEGGLTLQDKADLQQIQDANAAREKGNRQAILQNLAARGMGGSGAELAANLSNQQDSATRNASQSLNVAAQAQKRALDAVIQSGQLGGQIREQDFSEAARKAEAQDAIRRFNAANSIALQQRNVDRNNVAMAANAAHKQRAEEMAYNAPQQNYQNQMQKAQGVAAAKTGQSQAAGQRAQDTANQWAQGGSAIAQGANAYGQFTNQQEMNKLFQAWLETQKKQPTQDSTQPGPYASGYKF